MYDTAEYATSRLSETVIMLDGIPQYIGKVVENKGRLMALHKKLSPMFGMIVDDYEETDLDKFDLSPVKLGFYNTIGQGLSYLGRTPLRNDWKQGLRMNSVKSMWGLDKKNITLPKLTNTIMGIYPTFEQAMEIVCNEGMPTAFSRNFGLVRQNGEAHLVYKYFGVVGSPVDRKKDLINFSPSFSHLAEAYYETVGE